MCPLLQPNANRSRGLARSDFQPSIDVEINSTTGQVAAVYFYIRPGQQAKTLEYANGQAFADYDKDGQLLGIELLSPCEVTLFDQIASQEPEPVLKSLRESIPEEWRSVQDNDPAT